MNAIEGNFGNTERPQESPKERAWDKIREKTEEFDSLSAAEQLDLLKELMHELNATEESAQENWKVIKHLALMAHISELGVKIEKDSAELKEAESLLERAA